jgi:hypothetical protein
LLVPGFDVKSNILCHFVLSLTQSAIFAKTDEKKNQEQAREMDDFNKRSEVNQAMNINKTDR